MERGPHFPGPGWLAAGMVLGGLTVISASVFGKPPEEFVLEVPKAGGGPGPIRVFRCTEGLEQCIRNAHSSWIEGEAEDGEENEEFLDLGTPEVQPLHPGDKRSVELLQATLGWDYCGSWGCSRVVLERRGSSRWREVFSTFAEGLGILDLWTDDRHPALMQTNRYGCMEHAAFLSRWDGRSYRTVAMEHLGPLEIPCALDERSLRMLIRECPTWIERMESRLRPDADPESPDAPSEETATETEEDEDLVSVLGRRGLALSTRSCGEVLDCFPQNAWLVTELPEECAPGRSLVLVTRYQEEEGCAPWLIGEGVAWRPGPGPWMPLYVPDGSGNGEDEASEPLDPSHLLVERAPWPRALDFLADCPPRCRASEGPCAQVLQEVGGLGIGVTWYVPGDLVHLPCDQALVFY